MRSKSPEEEGPNFSTVVGVTLETWLWTGDPPMKLDCRETLGKAKMSKCGRWRSVAAGVEVADSLPCPFPFPPSPRSGTFVASGGRTVSKEKQVSLWRVLSKHTMRCTRGDPKPPKLTYKKLFIYSYTFKRQSPSKDSLVQDTYGAFPAAQNSFWARRC